jgi:hypothetical protein
MLTLSGCLIGVGGELGKESEHQPSARPENPHIDWLRLAEDAAAADISIASLLKVTAVFIKRPIARRIRACYFVVSGGFVLLALGVLLHTPVSRVSIILGLWIMVIGHFAISWREKWEGVKRLWRAMRSRRSRMPTPSSGVGGGGPHPSVGYD